ncbi:hypothetical protein J7J24_00180 [bacterium]|nr:hypothetical protein [bacterium]
MMKLMRTGIATNSSIVEDYSYTVCNINNIPDKPAIPLKNYLLDLINNTDDKNSSIYLKGVEGFIQQIWKEMVENNWRRLRIRKLIPEELGVHSTMFYSYKNGKKAISIQNLYKLLILWGKYCHKSQRELQKKWEQIYNSNFTFSVHKVPVPVRLPKFITPKLSYFLGWFCGDGHLAQHRGHYLINTTEKSIPQLEKILRPLFEQLFNVKMPLFVYPHKNVLQVGNKPIFRFVTQVLKVKVGEIPELVKNLDLINKKYFLAGVFDAEGSVDSSYLNSRIAIHQANYQFLKEAMMLFSDIDIRFTGPYQHVSKKGVWYHIQLREKKEIIKFIKEVGTFHLEKFKKIKILEKELYAHGYSYNST